MTAQNGSKGVSFVSVAVWLVVFVGVFIIVFVQLGKIKTENNVSALKNLEAKVQQAAALTFSAGRIQKREPNDSVEVDGKVVTREAGFPTADATGIDQLVHLDEYGFVSDGRGAFFKKGAKDPKRCSLTYLPLKTGIPKITLLDDGC